ncbi:MAG: peptidyl-prolyl cis-trans isomerase B (cyclophilin B) [Myxococcota bacterium]|jgi:peptidyl-prolyl cis-trans isomerase B (cyclophilin B)
MKLLSLIISPLLLLACDDVPAQQTPLALVPAPVQTVQTVQQPVSGPHHFEDATIVSDEQLKNYYIEMDCTIDGEAIGTMTFELWSEAAPIAVRNYLRYADEGLYNNRKYHRVLRDFMIQGGSSDNSAAGKGVHGNVKAEFSTDKERRHRYGVLSMARGGSPDSASSQFFVITDSYSPSVKGLDGKYTSFGIMVNGVATLEKIADIKTTSNPRGEPSNPTRAAVVTECRVVEGVVPKFAEIVRRPLADIGDEPEYIRIQHILISFTGTRTSATRTKEEAEALAAEVLKRAQSGEDFASLVMEFTDDPGGKDATPKGAYAMLNTGRHNDEAEEAAAAIQAEAQELQTVLMAQVKAEELTLDQAQAKFEESAKGLRARLSAIQWFQRGQMVPGFGNIGFKLQVGEIGISNFNKTDSPFGWHIIKRYE